MKLLRVEAKLQSTTLKLQAGEKRNIFTNPG